MPTVQMPPPPAPTERVTDAAITAAIETLLTAKKGLTAPLIAVQTRAGIVELTGCTSNLLAKQWAEDIALTVRGVRALHNALAVRPADVPDAELQHAVAHALADDPATDDYQVHGLAHHGPWNPLSLPSQHQRPGVSLTRKRRPRRLRRRTATRTGLPPTGPPPPHRPAGQGLSCSIHP